MDKMRMESVDVRQKNIEKIAELFPGTITEKLDERQSTSEEKVYKKAINFDMLRQLLSEEEIAGDEAYEFTWVGKKAAMIEANTPIRKTLRPCKEESKNWDTTENLYIEGDNLEVLKLLQESYLGKVKMIYIDPPYNTGNDFIYKDDFTRNIEDYEEKVGLLSEEGYKLFKNGESNGRFHSDWCSMMYSRLLVSRNILSDEGLIFISIANHEIDNMKKLGDEIFGNQNFVGIIDWESKTKCQNTKTAKYQLQNKQEYIIVYKKKPERYKFNLISLGKRDYPEKDENNLPYRLEQIGEMSSSGIRGRNTMIFEIEGVFPKEGNQWKYGKDTIDKFKKRNDLIVKNGKAYFKIREFDEEEKQEPFWSFISKEIGTAETAKNELKTLIGETEFETVKPVELMKKLIFHTCTNNDDIIMDFFSGSATTAHAVLKLNFEDRKKRNFIMVQSNMEIVEEKEGLNSNYKNICEIGKERIRRAGDKILSENPEVKDLDIGFRVFKVDESNMKDVYYAAGDYNQNLLDLMESNIKEDRNDLDLLFSCILEWGMPLSLPYSKEYIDGITIHNVADGDLIACFEENVSEEVIRKIAQKDPKPLRVVFRDSSFMNSPAKINVEEIFKLLSPNTKIKVL